MLIFSIISYVIWSTDQYLWYLCDNVHFHLTSDHSKHTIHSYGIIEGHAMSAGERAEFWCLEIYWTILKWNTCMILGNLKYDVKRNKIMATLIFFKYFENFFHSNNSCIESKQITVYTLCTKCRLQSLHLSNLISHIMTVSTVWFMIFDQILLVWPDIIICYASN